MYHHTPGSMAAAEVCSTSAIYAYWKDFDLDNRRSKLDEVRLVGWWAQACLQQTISQAATAAHSVTEQCVAVGSFPHKAKRPAAER